MKLRVLTQGKTAFIIVLLALLVAACGPKPGQNPPGGNPNPPGSGPNPPNTPPGPETTAEIGKDGGTIITENAELIIPENAVYGDQPAKITLKDLLLAPPGPVPPRPPSSPPPRSGVPTPTTTSG